MSVFLAIKYGILTLFLAIAAYTDIKSRIIPNMLVAIIFLAAIIFLLFDFSLLGAAIAFIGLAVAAAVFIATYFFSKSSLGAGDVKLALSVALYTGLFDFVNIMIYALIYTVIIGVALMIIKREKKGTVLPFAPFVLAGCITNIIYLIYMA